MQKSAPRPDLSRTIDGHRLPESEPRLAYLIVTLHGKEQQRRKLDGPLTVGRSLEADITLEDGAVSRQNSRIEPDGDKWVVVDLKSRNGTRVNGSNIERHELKEGDVIAVGHTKLRFHAGKFVGPRPSDPAAALLSETTIIMPASRREPSSRTLPTPKIGRVDVKPLPQQGNGHTPLPFTRPPARPIVKREE
jgi:pSer/pThr/pTyr-binding forkhead associated (FHA) protein